MSATTAVAKAAAPAQRLRSKKVAARPLLEAERNYSIPDGAAAAGVAAITFWRAIYAGHLQTYRAGRKRIVSGAQIKTWLESGGRTGNAKKGGGERCDK